MQNPAAGDMPASPRLTGRLFTLSDHARFASARSAKLTSAAAEQAMEMVVALGQARDLCDPPTWKAFLQEAGIAEDAARDLLELYRVTLHPGALVDLGGIEVAKAWAANLRLPKEGEVLAITAGRRSSVKPDPVAYVWPVEDGYCAGLMKFGDADFQGSMNRSPETRERVVWQCVWSLLGGRHAEMGFRLIVGNDAEVLVDALEARRRAMPGRAGGQQQ